MGWAEPRPGDLTENFLNLVETVVGERCMPACPIPHTRAWRQHWVRADLPVTTAIMPALARELIDH